ncbi:hypothetical protein BGZ80_000556 [Entomortierella chlamydospora]|uniref:Galactose oxidase n=1 Tax=Entomortierella chlamydospora TaxID=101097 RepID=A0A9P6SYM5_9FUNG|nr:hypothetical protein BGZ79_006222 [Entomortierella chlamydospora]KAG0011611.1 hypothetical protein BGZ80_000556 [Entomortierella chlamydospora]
MTLSHKTLSRFSRLIVLTALALFPAGSGAETPLPVQDLAFARVGSDLIVQGGKIVVNGVQQSVTGQTFALDLSSSWPTSSPSWRPFATGTPSTAFYGLSSGDNQTFITIKVVDTVSYTLSTLNVQQNTWQTVPLNNNDTYTYGVYPVLDPTTDLIYIAGKINMNVYNMKENVWTSTGIPANTLTQRYFGGAVYNKARHSIMYIGGYNYGAPNNFENSTYLTEYMLTPGKWSVVTTTGTLPSPRADFCMAISDDSNTIVVFGGRTRVKPTSVFTGSIYILNMTSGIWTQGPQQPPRIYTTCVIVGNQFVAWGGSDGNSTLSGTPLVYDLTTNLWVDNYTTPAYYTNAPVPTTGSGTSSGSGTSPTGSFGASGSDSTSPPSTAKYSQLPLGAIIGGAVGAAAVGALTTALFFVRKRKIERAKNDELAQRKALYAAERANAEDRNDRDGRANNHDDRTIAMAPAMTTTMQSSPPEYTSRDVIPPQTPKKKFSHSPGTPRTPVIQELNYSNPHSTIYPNFESRNPEMSMKHDIQSVPLDSGSSTRRNPQEGGGIASIYHEQESSFRSKNPQAYPPAHNSQE